MKYPRNMPSVLLLMDQEDFTLVREIFTKLPFISGLDEGASLNTVSITLEILVLSRHTFLSNNNRFRGTTSGIRHRIFLSSHCSTFYTTKDNRRNCMLKRASAIHSLILLFSPSRIKISDLQRETWGLRHSGDSCRKQLLLQHGATYSLSHNLNY